MVSSAIPSDHVKGVCSPGSSATCSFLMMGPRGWACAKSIGNEDLFIMILEKRLDGTIKAMGNNCDGINPDPDIPPISKWPERPKNAMIATSTPSTCFFIGAQDGLDAIHVFFIDRSSGVGYVTIICFGQAWTAFFGAMGGETIREFFCSAPTDYMVGKMSTTKATKADLKYLTRVVEAAKRALSAEKATV